jgi:hypothetical protein
MRIKILACRDSNPVRSINMDIRYNVYEKHNPFANCILQAQMTIKGLAICSLHSDSEEGDRIFLRNDTELITNYFASRPMGYCCS